MLIWKKEYKECTTHIDKGINSALKIIYLSIYSQFHDNIQPQVLCICQWIGRRHCLYLSFPLSCLSGIYIMRRFGEYSSNRLNISVALDPHGMLK